MSRTLSYAAALLLGASSLAVAQNAPAGPRLAPSTRATAEVGFMYPQGSTPPSPAPSIRLDYGQPHLRGRTLHTDSLVPYDRPWRTGANAATTLTTGVDLTIGGQSVPAGSYVVWTLPSAQGWTLVLQRPPAAAQQGQYVDANTVARIPLRLTTLPQPVESLSMWLIPATTPGAMRGELRMAWGTSQLSTDWQVALPVEKR